MVFNSSGGYFVAKRVKSGLEVDILQHLKSISGSAHRNHTIPIVDILPLRGDMTLVIMPQHTVLGGFNRLTQEGYYQLRHQLAEVSI